MKLVIIKKLYRIICIFICLMSLAGCDAIYRMLQKEGAEERDLLGEVVLHQRNEKVLEVQKLLKLYGYRIGTPDGVLGGNTRNSIESFQQTHGLKPSRFVDKATWDRLHIFDQYGLLVKGDLNIAKIQEVLKAAGINPGRVDGKLGKRTQQAIIDFQKREGLKPDGKVGWKTLQKFAEYLNLKSAKE